MHRDIKTGNILLSKDCDSAKICDVGLARIMNNTSIASSSHNATGTYAYAAPEILLFERWMLLLVCLCLATNGMDMTRLPAVPACL